MAKNAKSEQTDATAASVTASITIQEIPFNVPSPYAEGHVLTPEEASTLNQVLHENLRNNFAKAVKTAKEEAAKNSTELDLADLQSKFAAYAAEYKFNGKRQSRAPTDPVAKEAHKIAKSIVMEKLRERKIDVKTLKEGQLEGLIDQLIEKNPAIKEEAQRRVDAIKAAGSMSIADLGLDAA